MMLAPKGFTQTIDKEAFISAQLAVSKRSGLLRFTVPVLLFAAILVIGGVTVLFSGTRSFEAFFSGSVIVLLGCMLAGAFLTLVPEAVKTLAAADFTAYDTLTNGAEITMTADEMSIRSDAMTRRVEYAKTRLCIETAARFVILTDDDNTVILEKECFCQREETERFLRDVFARWYIRKERWS